MLTFLSNLLPSCTANCVTTSIAVAVLLYLLFAWIFKPRLLDSYFNVDEAKFYDLKYVGKHSSEIALKDIPHCIQEMKQIYRSNITRILSERKKQLRNLQRMLEENEHRIHEAIRSDLGRSNLLTSAYDIYPVIAEIKKFLKHIDSWSAPQRMGLSLLTFPSYDVHVIEPYGTVYINGIWNFPFQLSCSPIAGAIAAGNNVIFKPCNTAHKSALLLADLLHKYMDSKFVQVIGHPTVANGDDYVVTDKILEHQFDFIFFTGSTNGGRYIMEKATKYLTPMVLELGGKNAVIIDDTADLEAAAKQLMNARVINCGQQCISPDYVLCYESVVDTFIELCVKYASKWFKIGDNLKEDLGVNQARIVNGKQLERVRKLLASTKGKVMFGGGYDEKTLMFEPTIVKLKNIKYIDEEETMKSETFGPILWIVPINNDIKEAVRYVQNEPKSLSMYMFSKNKKHQNYVMHNTSSGALQINGVLTYAGHGGVRFGGIGKSGIGAYHGKHSFDTFSHKKPVIKSYIDNPLVYPYFSDEWRKKVLKFAFYL